MDGDNSTRTFTEKVRELTPLLTGISVIIMLTAAGILAWFLFQQPDGANENQRFISLLIVFMLAMGATAALFAALGLGNAGEAFGLPSGSIRALLALGIMMLFVAFGMPVLSAPSDSLTKELDARVPAAQRDETVRSYREQGFLVVVTEPGSEGTTTTGGTTTPTNAQLKIIARLPARSPDQVDLTKQLLTAIVTLLTTVIGFYFGSRTSTDAIREAGGNPPATPPTPAQLRRQIADALTLAKTQIAEAAQRIRQLKEKDDGTDPDRIARIQAAETLKEAIDQKRTEIERLLTEADAALTAAASATSTEDRTRHETAAAGHLRQANDLLGRLRTEVTSWLETVRAIA